MLLNCVMNEAAAQRRENTSITSIPTHTLSNKILHCHRIRPLRYTPVLFVLLMTSSKQSKFLLHIVRTRDTLFCCLRWWCMCRQNADRYKYTHKGNTKGEIHTCCKIMFTVCQCWHEHVFILHAAYHMVLTLLW